MIDVVGAAGLTTLLQGRRAILVRHGNTGKADVDSERVLTDKGRAQCEGFRIAWGEVLSDVSMIAASPVRRTMETAALLSGPIHPKESTLFIYYHDTNE